MTTVQNRKKTSQVMYNSITSPLFPSGKASKYEKILSRENQQQRESNRTVGLPKREVGSPLLIVPLTSDFVNPISLPTVSIVPNLCQLTKINP